MAISRGLELCSRRELGPIRILFQASDRRLSFLSVTCKRKRKEKEKKNKRKTKTAHGVHAGSRTPRKHSSYVDSATLPKMMINKDSSSPTVT